MHPAGDATAAFAASTLCLDGTACAGVGGVILDLSVLFGGLEAEGQLLSCGAPVVILLGVVTEIIFGEEPALAAGGSLRFGDERRDARIQAGFDFHAVVVAHVCQDFEFVHTEQLLYPLGHVAEEIPVGDGVGDFVIGDQLVLLVDADLHVALCQDGIAHVRPAASADGHHAAVGVGEGDLGFSALVELLFQLLGFFPHALHFFDFLLQFFGGELFLIGFFCIGFVHLVQIAIDVLVQLADGVFELLLGEVAIAAVDCFELAAVDGDQVAAEEIEFAAEEGEFLADPTDGLPIVPAEIGDGFEVGCELLDEPHDFDVAVGFPFQLTAGADVVEIAI